MAARGVERTAAGAGMMRALEGRARRPLFDDPIAERLMTGWTAVVVAHGPLRWAFLRAMDRAGPGFYGAVVCRTRVIDDVCRRALADGVAQVVLLGAGMDTRAYRMPEMRAARVWELDLPTGQEAKRAAPTRERRREVMRAQLAQVRAHRPARPVAEPAGARAALPPPRLRDLPAPPGDGAGPPRRRRPGRGPRPPVTRAASTWCRPGLR
jgi:hypothetical protein